MEKASPWSQLKIKNIYLANKFQHVSEWRTMIGVCHYLLFSIYCWKVIDEVIYIRLKVIKYVSLYC